MREARDFSRGRVHYYPRWFEMCVVLLQDISGRYDGIIYVPMTLALPESFEKFARPLRKSGIPVNHILLESNHATVLERILERGEETDCWCAQHIDFCLEQQGKFKDVIRIPSVGQLVTALAMAVRMAMSI